MVVQTQRPPVPSIVTRDVDRLSSSIDGLQTIVRELKEIIVGRPDLDTQVPISSTVPYIINYRERLKVYLYSPIAMTLTVEDFGAISVPGSTWIDISFQQGVRLVSNLTAQNLILVRCSDNIYVPNSLNLSTLGGSFITLGQKVMANSLPVVVASDQSTIPTSNTSFPYPTGATPITGASGNVANATATATLVGVAARTTYISGFEITGTGATAALIVLPTVTGVVTGTLTYVYTFVAGATTQNQSLIVEFPEPIPSSAVNTNIAVSCPASGAGGTNNTVNAHGYLL